MYAILIALCFAPNPKYEFNCYPIGENPVVWYLTKAECTQRMKQIGTKELLEHMLHDTTEKGRLIGRCVYSAQLKPELGSSEDFEGSFVE